MPQRGIFFGWYIVGASLALFVLTGGLIFYGFPVFFDAILDEYPWSTAAAALAIAIVRLEGGVLGPLWGWLVDRVGTRAPMLVGTALMAAGYVILSRIDSLSALYLGYALVGLGMSVYYPAPIAAISNWFRTRRALALGIASTGFGLSGVMAHVLDWGIQVYGWRSMFIAAGFATLALGVPLSLVLRHRPEPYGYSVDGIPAPAQGDGETDQDVQFTDSSFTAAEALRTRALWVLVGLLALSWVGFVGLVPHMVTYLTDVGIEREFVTLSIMGMTTATVLGRVGGGALGDRIDKRRVMAGGFLVLPVGLLLFATISQPWQLALFVVVAGPSVGSLLPIVPALIGDYFGTRSFALILALVSAPAALIWFATPSAVGWVFDHYGTYQPAWLALAGVTLIGLPLVLMLRPPKPPDRSGP